ncbi:MAG: hypothetical protein Q8M88_13615 [Phenylobacterium sp.]|uniref:hypothetical protein n=1 Tax=Phenylobacterium sp. TaxID=1871053 RepID=UPI002737281C|nr:hypothetical protein [Phenylobacterium sp.]MDP3175466.1 hypothetical protein [Phenylobacterium sp.]
MARAVWVRSALSVAAAAAALVITACAGPSAGPPAPPAPAVSLAPKVIEQASAYRAYMARSAAISPAFSDGASVSGALRTAAAYEPRQLVQGAVAYGAIAALQDPAYVAGVRTYSRDVTQRQSIAQAIIRNPAYALSFPGAPTAAGLVTTALGEDGRRVFEQGKQVKQAAYSVQHFSWSKADVANRDIRLAQAKSLSTMPLSGDVAESFRLQQAAGGGAPLGVVAAQPGAPPYSPLVVRSLALAALAVLGEAGEANLVQLTSVMSEPVAGSCLNMSKLNLYQCLAVSKPHYEDVFCMGQHILMDTGMCVLKGAGAPNPVDVLTSPLTVASATPVATQTPIASPTSGVRKP